MIKSIKGKMVLFQGMMLVVVLGVLLFCFYQEHRDITITANETNESGV